MTVTYVRENVARTTTIPEHLLNRWQDQLRTLAEKATRVHDEIAYEVGYERVRIEQVRAGDVIASAVTGRFYEVDQVHQRVDPPGEWFDVIFTDANGQCPYDAGQFVSRRLPETDEAF